MATAAPAEVAEEAALLRRVMFWRFQRDFSLGGLCRGLGSLIVCCIVFLCFLGVGILLLRGVGFYFDGRRMMYRFFSK